MDYETRQMQLDHLIWNVGPAYDVEAAKLANWARCKAEVDAAYEEAARTGREVPFYLRREVQEYPADFAG